MIDADRRGTVTAVIDAVHQGNEIIKVLFRTDNGKDTWRDMKNVTKDD